MKKLIPFVILALTGCQALFPPKPPMYPETEPVNKDIAAVIVSVEQSYLGENPGAYNDAWMMYDMCTNVTDDVTVIMNDKSSKKRVKEALAKAVEKPLAIFYFSGHGNREYTWKDKTEVDHYNDYMVLANSALVDDEVWEIISKSKGRVFLMFNCCRAETMYRDVAEPFNFSAKQVKPEEATFGMMSWGASKEDKSALTSLSGGAFTKAIYNTYYALDPADRTYENIWNIIRYSSDMVRKQGQIPARNYFNWKLDDPFLK